MAGSSSGGGMTMTPTGPDTEPFSGTYEPLGLSAQGLTSLADMQVAPAAAKKGPHPQVGVQQSTNQSGGDTNDTINVAFRLRETPEEMRITHTGGGSGGWSVTVQNFITSEDDFTTEIFSAAVSNPSATGTVYAFAGVYSKGLEGAALRFNIDQDDYEQWGVWAYVPNDQTMPGAFELGAWAEAGQFVETVIDTGTGMATYAGDAAGMLLGTVSQTRFTGDVSLNADFGADTISGVINGIEDLDGNSLALQFALEEGSIAETGFFGGALNSGGSDAPRDDISGSWGGNFAVPGVGTAPDIAVGTFGGKDGDSGDVLIGAFISRRQSP